MFWCIFLCCLHSIFIVNRVFTQEESCNYIIKGILWLGSQDQAINTVDNMPKSNGWRIVSIENTMTYSTLLVHITMIDRGYESDLRGFEWIISWEINIEKKQAIFIRSLFRAQKQYLPDIDVFTRINCNKRVGVIIIILNLFSYSFQSCTTWYFFLSFLALILFDNILRW